MKQSAHERGKLHELDIKPKQKVALTLRTQAKQQRTRKLAEARMIDSAKNKSLAASKAQTARAAASLPMAGIRESTAYTERL